MNGRLRGAQTGCSFLLVVAPLLSLLGRAGLQGSQQTALMAIQITKGLNSRRSSAGKKGQYSRAIVGRQTVMRRP